MKRSTKLIAGLLVLAAVATTAVARADAPIVVRPASGVEAPVTKGRVDHGAYDALLKKYVDERGLVNYAAWKASGRPALEGYLAQMAAVKPDTLADKDEKLAYWINVYNALTLHGMLHFYPTKSIKDHVSRLWGFHFWKDVRIEVAGKERSLDAIEHEILRKMGEPRIHFAIVCASIGCPKLRNEAFVARSPAGDGEAPAAASRLDTQLEEQTEDFFNDAVQFRIDRAKKVVYLSAILEWFGGDFGGSDRAKLDFAARYVRSDDDRAFLKRNDLSIRSLDYDWGINERKQR